MKLFSDTASAAASKKRRLAVADTGHQKQTQQQESSSPAESIEAFRRNLPVYPFRRKLIDAIHHRNNKDNNNKVLLVVAETGSGKSTQIPAYLLNTSHRIAVTQPRRVAAMTLAERVSYENSGAGQLGRQVGYRVRFDDRSSSHETQLLYVTDGMLLRESMVDPLLSRYSVIFLDEAHERSLQTDILIGIVQRARKARNNNNNNGNNNGRSIRSNPLKVVLMSATLEVDAFVDFFGGSDNVQVMRIPGRQYKVQTLYASDPVDDYVEATLSAIMQIHLYEPTATTTAAATTANNNTNGNKTNDNGGGEGDCDILAFLPGQEEIEDVAALLKQQLREQDDGADADWAKGDRVVPINQSKASSSKSNASHQIVNGVMICSLYAALPPEAQLAAFQKKPTGCVRKIILATTIAETSVTIPSIKYVVDCGKYKCRQIKKKTTTSGGGSHHASTSTTGIMESLTVEDVSQAQAMQRTGRAGRVADGICFRLYTEGAYDRLDKMSTPEITRVNLAQVVLQLKSMGVSDVANFDFVTPPDQSSLIRSMKLLYALNALDDEMELTEYGKKLATMPLDPVFGHLLLQSSNYSCVEEMITAVSVLSAADNSNLFYRPNSASACGGSLSSSNNSNSKAASAHRRFASHEGDLPTYLNVYDAWQNEAVYVPSSSGGRKAQRKRLKQQQQQQQRNGGGRRSRNLLSHSDWCQQNYVSGRALARAYHVRQQLKSLCERPVEKNGLGMDFGSGDSSRYNNNGNNNKNDADRERFLKCVAAGLFLQVASRVKIVDTGGGDHRGHGKGRGSGSVLSSSGGGGGRYRTKVGNELVSIHPASSMFGRHPAPACVTYTELVTTKKSYIRGVTQIREEWLHEVAKDYYNPK